MRPWLRLLIGDEVDRIPEDARLEFSWLDAPSSWWGLVFVALMLLAVYLVWSIYRREQKTCSGPRKLLLGCLRCAAIGLLALVWLHPVLRYTVRRELTPAVVILRDDSQSMNTPDLYLDEKAALSAAAVLGQSPDQVRSAHPSRAMLVNKLLEGEQNTLLKDLAAKGSLRIINFSDKPEAASDQLPPQPLEAKGRSSDLTAAIDEALTASPLAAIVVFSDGQHTAPSDPRAAARRAGQRKAPVFAIGVGDPARPRNIRLANLYVRPQVWPEEPFEIKATLQATAIEPRGVKVELLEHVLAPGSDKLGAGTVVEQKTIELQGSATQFPIAFTRQLAAPGRYAYTVRAEILETEQLTDDNAQSSSILTVLDKEKTRVLLIAGTPSWEYRLLQPLLQRDRTVRVFTWLQTLDEGRGQAGAEPLVQFPATEAELFKYDVIVLLDPLPLRSELNPEWVALLHKFVTEHSGGLLFMAGPKFSAAALTDPAVGPKLRELLPVKFGDLATIEVASLLSTNSRDWPLAVVAANSDHPLLQFYENPRESQKRWQELPGIFWSFPALEPKPTAKVLLEHSDPTLRRVEGSRPLMVAGRYGSGRVVYLGFNGTWRWRRAGVEAEFFDRFWIQAARHLSGGRSLQGQRRGQLQAERERYEVGDKVSLLAEVKDPAFQPLIQPTLEGSLVLADAPPLPLTFKPLADQPGQYSAVVTPRRPGVHTVRIPIPGVAGDDPATGGAFAQTTFSVELPSVETNHTWMNRPLLRELAELSGGKYLEVSETAELGLLVPDRRETNIIPARPIALWDNSLLLGLGVGLLCTEWALRKYFKLL